MRTSPAAAQATPVLRAKAERRKHGSETKPWGCTPSVAAVIAAIIARSVVRPPTGVLIALEKLQLGLVVRIAVAAVAVGVPATLPGVAPLTPAGSAVDTASIAIAVETVVLVGGTANLPLSLSGKQVAKAAGRASSAQATAGHG